MSKRVTLPSRKRKTCSTVLSFSPLRLALKRLTLEIADGLPNLCDDCVVSSPVEAHRFDVRTDHGPLAGPVLAHGLATMNVAAIHAVGPSDIIGKNGQHAIDIPRIEAVIDAFQDFDIIVRRALSSKAWACRASALWQQRPMAYTAE